MFSWFDEDYYARSMSTDGTGRQIGAIVLSNTGRTSGSIIAVKRDGDSGKPMTLCMPSFTEDGRYDKTVKPSVGTGLAALDPGDSRLVFYMTGNGGKLDRTETLRIVTTSGQTLDAARIRNVSKEAMDHYASLEGWFDAVNACENAMDDARLRSPQPPAAVLQLVHGPAGRYRRARAGGGRGQRTVQSPSDALPGMGRRAGGTRPGCGVRASDGGVMDRKASRSSGRRSARIHRSSMSTVPIRCRGEGWSSTRHAAGPSSG